MEYSVVPPARSDRGHGGEFHARQASAVSDVKKDNYTSQSAYLIYKDGNPGVTHVGQ